MKKTIKLVISLILVFSAALMLLVPASAASVGEVVYKNDFSSTELDETMWYKSGGTVAVMKEYGEQFLRCTSVVGSARKVELSFGPKEIKNVDISFRIRAAVTNTHTAARMGIYFRSATIPASENFAYQFRLSEAKTTVVNMNSHFDTQTKALAEDFNITARAGLWNNVKVCLRENRIVIYVNGELACDFKDDIYPAEGGFGICGERYTFDVDDIVMTHYSGKALPEPTANEAPLWAGEFGTEEPAELADTLKDRFNPFAEVGGIIEQTKDTASKISVTAIVVIAILALLLIGIIIILVILIIENKKNKKPALNDDNSEKEVEQQ